ncbi:hypothetical protein EAG_10648 [Camponotus floridanus]|uniref:Uncharacterized protein n=1 Tax=Camponotus floridanus TaxID=104421 RepID=E2ASY5_CAMFO|nr:hypothetical protein EAG_10648 [Camponotus floridanus]
MSINNEQQDSATDASTRKRMRATTPGPSAESITLQTAMREMVTYPIGEGAPVKFKVIVQIKVGQFSVELPVFVADISEDCLLGADFLKAVKLENVFRPFFGESLKETLTSRDTTLIQSVSEVWEYLDIFCFTWFIWFMSLYKFAIFYAKPGISRLLSGVSSFLTSVLVEIFLNPLGVSGFPVSVPVEVFLIHRVSLQFPESVRDYMSPDSPGISGFLYLSESRCFSAQQDVFGVSEPS